MAPHSSCRVINRDDIGVVVAICRGKDGIPVSGAQNLESENFKFHKVRSGWLAPGCPQPNCSPPTRVSHARRTMVLRPRDGNPTIGWGPIETRRGRRTGARGWGSFVLYVLCTSVSMGVLVLVGICRYTSATRCEYSYSYGTTPTHTITRTHIIRSTRTCTYVRDTIISYGYI